MLNFLWLLGSKPVFWVQGLAFLHYSFVQGVRRLSWLVLDVIKWFSLNRQMLPTNYWDTFEKFHLFSSKIFWRWSRTCTTATSTTSSTTRRSSRSSDWTHGRLKTTRSFKQIRSWHFWCTDCQDDISRVPKAAEDTFRKSLLYRNVAFVEFQLKLLWSSN